MRAVLVQVVDKQHRVRWTEESATQGGEDMILAGERGQIVKNMLVFSHPAPPPNEHNLAAIVASGAFGCSRHMAVNASSMAHSHPSANRLQTLSQLPEIMLTIQYRQFVAAPPPLRVPPKCETIS